MRTHRGINISSVAGEGLSDFPGVLIAAFFLVGGAYVICVTFVPEPMNVWLFLVALITAACLPVGYLLGQRRDAKLTAQLEQAFRSLNEPEGQGVTAVTPTGSDQSPARDEPHRLGLEAFKAEELQRAAHASLFSPGGVLIVVVLLFFFWGMSSIFAPYDWEPGLAGGFLAVTGGTVIGYSWHRLRVRWRTRRAAPDGGSDNDLGEGNHAASA